MPPRAARLDWIFLAGGRRSKIPLGIRTPGSCRSYVFCCVSDVRSTRPFLVAQGSRADCGRIDEIPLRKFQPFSPRTTRASHTGTRARLLFLKSPWRREPAKVAQWSQTGPDLNPVEKFWGWPRKRLRAMDLADFESQATLRAEDRAEGARPQFSGIRKRKARCQELRHRLAQSLRGSKAQEGCRHARLGWTGFF